MQKQARRFMVFFLALSFMFGTFMGFSAQALTAKMITIKTNSDINPFIRIGLHKRTFASGGPFTVKCEIKIDSYQKLKPDSNIFVNITDGRDPENMVVWLNQYRKPTDGWVEMKQDNGNFITFNNIDKVMISGAFEEFALLQMGAYFVKGVVSFRNFRVYNAANMIVYSWDTDENFKEVTNLKDFGGDTAFACTFGDGSGEFQVSNSDLSGKTSAATTTKDDGPLYESTTSSSTNKTTPTKAIDTTSLLETTTTSSDEETAETTDEIVDDTTLVSTTSTLASDVETDEKESSILWLPISIVGGLIILLGTAFLILWKTKKLPWQNN
ncbi:MAG: hypothetical protein PHH84_01585 [Oscillospiraceae bacterium]|nr:hypothetical protein [Oscillospiraceae bacterium]MDD4545687.1 hypothetical protein [Oscillospiraceae bacterium]